MKLAVCFALFAVALAAPIAEDFKTLKERLDREILHVEDHLNRLFLEANVGIHHNDDAKLRTVIHETMQMEVHLHHLDATIQKEMATRKGDVSHYYLDRKLHEVRVMFTQAADIMFKIAEHHRNHGHVTHAPHTTHHHHWTHAPAAPGADFDKLKAEVDADLAHIELELDRLHRDADEAVSKNDENLKRNVVHETAGVEFHLHHVQVKLEAELKVRHNEVHRYYLERRIEEVHIFFRQAADIFFKIGVIRDHTNHHHHTTHHPHTTHHHHDRSTWHHHHTTNHQ